jgi:drug/metabolite transporter (DMT)-like permease
VTDLAEPLPGVAAAPRVRPGRGYLLYLLAAVLFSLNGTVAKTVLLAGIDATRLSELRVTGAFIVLLAFIALTRPPALRLRLGEVPLLLVYGILGVAATQSLYFLAIERLPIGVSLLIEFTAPLMVALWFRFALGHPTRPAVWLGLVLALAGLAVVAQVWDGFTLDATGVAAAAGAAVALAIYYLTADMQVHGPYHRDPVSLTMWGMGAATLFWAVVQPWWTFPWASFTGTAPLGDAVVPIWPLATYVVLLGTVVPFSLVVLSMQHLRASQASVVGMTEPIIATAIAWLVLGEVLSPAQLAGAALVLCGILLAELNR